MLVWSTCNSAPARDVTFVLELKMRANIEGYVNKLHPGFSSGHFILIYFKSGNCPCQQLVMSIMNDV